MVYTSFLPGLLVGFILVRMVDHDKSLLSITSIDIIHHHSPTCLSFLRGRPVGWPKITPKTFYQDSHFIITPVPKQTHDCGTFGYISMVVPRQSLQFTILSTAEMPRKHKLKKHIRGNICTQSKTNT